MSRSAQSRMSLPVISRREVSVPLEKPAEVGRVFETQLVTDLIRGAATEKQQPFGFLHEPLLDESLRWKVCDSTTYIVQPWLCDSNTSCIPRKRPMLTVMSFNQLIESVKNLEILPSCRRRLHRVGAQPKQADHDQSRQIFQSRTSAWSLISDFITQLFEHQLNTPRFSRISRRKAGQRNTCRRHLETRRHEAAICLNQLPYQLLANRQHVPVAVLLSDEGMRDRRGRKEEHRAGLDVLLIIEIHTDGTRFHVVNLEEPIMPMDRHVPAKKSGEIAQSVVVNLAIAVALVVHLADVDIRDWLAISHRFLLVFLVVAIGRYAHGAPVSEEALWHECLTVVNILNITLTH